MIVKDRLNNNTEVHLPTGYNKIERRRRRKNNVVITIMCL